MKKTMKNENAALIFPYFFRIWNEKEKLNLTSGLLYLLFIDTCVYIPEDIVSKAWILFSFRTLFQFALFCLFSLFIEVDFLFLLFFFFFGAMSHKILTNFSPKAVGKIFRHLSVRLHLINLKANSASQLWANFLLQFEFPLFFWKYDKNLVRRKLSAHCKVHLKCTSPCVFPFFFTQLNIYSHCWSFISVNWPSRKSFKLSGVFVLFFQKKI